MFQEAIIDKQLNVTAIREHLEIRFGKIRDYDFYSALEITLVFIKTRDIEQRQTSFQQVLDFISNVVEILNRSNSYVLN